MKDETSGFTTDKFDGLKLKMYSFLVDDSSEHKKAKSVNKYVFATTIHSQYKDVLLNNKYLMHSVNRIQSKNDKMGSYEINKIYLPSFDDKINILNNGYDGLVLCLLELIMKQKLF